MSQTAAISGFSKLTREEKIKWMKENFNLEEEDFHTIDSHLHLDEGLQAVYNEFSENTLSNFYIPFGLAPNFLINGKWYVIPMAIEESSVVAAASNAAKFWSSFGGFKAEVIDTIKIGQVHFSYKGSSEALEAFFNEEKEGLLLAMNPLTSSMKNRGGGIKSLSLKSLNDVIKNYFQLFVEFQTADAMGANFINTVLEELARKWSESLNEALQKERLKGEFELHMSILSNYTPESLVKVSMQCDVSAFDAFVGNGSGVSFAKKFVKATEIAQADTHRAVTHNKGIFNGMDAVIVATGNDYRAVEACGHAFAAKDGRYKALSKAKLIDKQFFFELEVPLSVGTVGGLTSGHPMAKTSLKLLNNPSAKELMMIIAAAGLANNFSAVRALVTSGIQKGHMKMHLSNMLRQLEVNDLQKQQVINYFGDRPVNYTALKKYVSELKS